MAKKKKKNKKIELRSTKKDTKKSSSSSKTSLSSSEKKALEQNLKTLQSTLDNKNVSSSQKKEIQKQIDSIKKEVGNSSSKKDEKADEDRKEGGKKDREASFKDEDGDGKNDDVGFYDDSSLRGTDEFKSLNKEDQQAVLAVFGAVAGNDKVKADRLSKAFSAASKINDPYFAQQLKMAQDAITRGYVEIEKEAAFGEMQLRNRLADLKTDYQNKKSFLTADQANIFKDLERTYTQNLQTLQDDLAANGLTNSSARAKREGVLNEATGDLRESTNRKFEYEQNEIVLGEQRSQRDSDLELSRLGELTQAGKLDFLRKNEAVVGSKNMPTFNGGPALLGNIYGSLPEEKLKNTIEAAKSFVF